MLQTGQENHTSTSLSIRSAGQPELTLCLKTAICDEFLQLFSRVSFLLGDTASLDSCDGEDFLRVVMDSYQGFCAWQELRIAGAKGCDEREAGSVVILWG